MANSPFKDFMDAFGKLLSGIHTGEWLISLATGKKLPDSAPTIAKATYGLLHGGDEVVLQVLLEKLAEEDEANATNHRENVLNFLYWLRARGKSETIVSEGIAWYYFNGFRTKVAQMHEASKGIRKETVPGKKGKDGEKSQGPTTVETQTYSEDSDAGLMFLRRISEIIEKYKAEVVAVGSSGAASVSYNYESGYEEVIKFLKVSGVPVMPDLSALSDLQTTLVKYIRDFTKIAGDAKGRYDRWELSESKKYDERLARRHPIVKFFMKFL